MLNTWDSSIHWYDFAAMASGQSWGVYGATFVTANHLPTISDIPSQSTPQQVPAGPIAFSIGDVETAASSLTLIATSSNATLLPNENITFGGAGASRTLTATPAAGQWGTTTITVTVSDGTATASGTFSLEVMANGQISGQTFGDTDSDGVKDAGEHGLQGWTIQLDLNNDGSVDRTTTTDASGDYTFTDVPAGTHKLAEVTQSGWIQTLPAAGTYTVTVASGQTVTGRDFGNHTDPATWTFLVYMDGDNNLESAGVVDFLEMATVGSNSSLKIAVQFDRISGYETTNGDWTDTRRGLVIAGGVPDASWGTSIGEANMGNPSTLVDFVNWGMANNPAQKYALVLWDHGGGLDGVCWDDTGNDHLTNREVAPPWPRSRKTSISSATIPA